MTAFRFYRDSVSDLINKSITVLRSGVWIPLSLPYQRACCLDLPPGSLIKMVRETVPLEEPSAEEGTAGTHPCWFSNISPTGNILCLKIKKTCVWSCKRWFISYSIITKTLKLVRYYYLHLISYDPGSVQSLRKDCIWVVLCVGFLFVCLFLFLWFFCLFYSFPTVNLVDN